MKAVPAALAFTARPDSAIRTDAAQDRKMALDIYSMLAREPFVNRQELLKQILRKMDLDATKLIVQPPEPKPEPPRIQVVVKGEDFVGPQAPVMVELLKVCGVVLSPAALQQTGQMAAMQAAMVAQANAQAAAQAPAKPGAQPPHGGMAPKAETLQKHPPEGNMQGTGQPAPMAPGGAGMVQ
jgi:hypothetical protein